MGFSATGEVFFGYDLGDLSRFYSDEYDWTGPAWALVDGEDTGNLDGWEDRLAAVRGHELVPYPEHIAHLPDGERRAHADFLAWGVSRDEVRRIASESPVELHPFGHVDAETYWRVQVRKSVKTAECGECVPPFLDGFGYAWLVQLDEFMRALDLPVPDHPPGWFVTASYG